MVNKVNAIQAIDTSDLVKNTDKNPKIKDMKDKIPDLAKYITINEFKRLFAPLFNETVKEVKIATKKDPNTIILSANENKEKVEKLKMFKFAYW